MSCLLMTGQFIFQVQPVFCGLSWCEAGGYLNTTGQQQYKTVLEVITTGRRQTRQGDYQMGKATVWLNSCGGSAV